MADPRLEDEAVRRLRLEEERLLEVRREAARAMAGETGKLGGPPPTAAPAPVPPTAAPAPVPPTAEPAPVPARPVTSSPAADARQALLETTIEARRSKGEAGYLGTPQGQALLAEQRRLDEEKRQAAEQVRQLRDPKPAFDRFMAPLDRFGGALTKLTPVVGQLQGAFDMTIGTLMQFGAKASPAHAATLQGSLDLFSARMGQSFLPAMESAARSIQTAARALPDPESRTGRLTGDVLKSLFGITSMELLQKWFGGGQGELKRSLAGLPQAQISTAEQYAERLQLQALNTDDIQTEILKEQLKALEKLIGLFQGGPERRGDQIIVPFR